MAEASPSGDGQAAQTTATQTTTATPAAPVRPDWVPDQFWNTQKGEVDVQGMASGFKDLSTRFAKGKEALIPEIKSELTKEFFGKRPEKPEMYKFDLPKEGPLAEKLSKSNLVIMGEKPGADFQKEQGKLYYVLNKDGPTFKLGQEIAHKMGLDNNGFMELAHRFAEIEAQKEGSRQTELSTQIATNRKALGDNADKRIEYIKGKVKVIAGDKAADALDLDYLPASGVEALEKILEKAGEPRFSSGPATQEKKDASELRAELKTLQESKDYYESPGKQNRAFEIARQISTIDGPAQLKKKA